MLVIDSDSHLIEPLDWLDQVDPALEAELRGRAPTNLMEMLLAEFVETIPEGMRPPAEDLIPSGQRAVANMLNGARSAAEEQQMIADQGLDVIFNPPGGWKANERAAFCNEHGIDVQLCLPNFALAKIFGGARIDYDLGRRVAAAFNLWTTQNLASQEGKLIPVVYTPLDDAESAERELTKARAAGSRAWLVPMSPVNGRVLGDRIYDRLWAASLDLGMVPVFHVGIGSAHFDPAWARRDGTPDAFQIMSYVGIHTPMVAQMALTSMIYGGVFDRFPNLIVSVSECGIGWIDEWIERVGPQTRTGAPNATMFFPWTLGKTPDDYLKRNMRFTPLRGQRVDEVIAKFGPDLVMYASDYPHPEGIQVDWSFYDRQLEGFDAETKANFFGGAMAKVLGVDGRNLAA